MFALAQAIVKNRWHPTWLMTQKNSTGWRRTTDRWSVPICSSSDSSSDSSSRHHIPVSYSTCSYDNISKKLKTLR
jgi:hypothetical protein